jgi:hypothetical protein
VFRFFVSSLPHVERAFGASPAKHTKGRRKEREKHRVISKQAMSSRREAADGQRAEVLVAAHFRCEAPGLDVS